MTKFWKVIVDVLLVMLLLFSSCYFFHEAVKAQEGTLKITKIEIVKEKANTIYVMVETEGYDGVGITIKVTLVSPDRPNEIIEELGVPKINKIDATRKDLTGYPEGGYAIVVKAKHGDSWKNSAREYELFQFVPSDN